MFAATISRDGVRLAAVTRKMSLDNLVIAYLSEDTKIEQNLLSLPMALRFRIVMRKQVARYRGHTSLSSDPGQYPQPRTAYLRRLENRPSYSVLLIHRARFSSVHNRSERRPVPARSERSMIVFLRWALTISTERRRPTSSGTLISPDRGKRTLIDQPSTFE